MGEELFNTGCIHAFIQHLVSATSNSTHWDMVASNTGKRPCLQVVYVCSGRRGHQSNKQTPSSPPLSSRLALSAWTYHPSIFFILFTHIFLFLLQLLPLDYKLLWKVVDVYSPSVWPSICKTMPGSKSTFNIDLFLSELTK